MGINRLISLYVFVAWQVQQVTDEDKQQQLNYFKCDQDSLHFLYTIFQTNSSCLNPPQSSERASKHASFN